MDDTLIIGGGAIGLSLAYELARRGEKVRVIERGLLGRESSWAGAGIVPPAIVRAEDPPLAQLGGHAYDLHIEWNARLKHDTGIDTGYHCRGALYLAQDTSVLDRLENDVAPFRAQNLPCEKLTAAKLAEVEPALAGAMDDGRITAGYYVPGEAQLRNPWYIRALEAACSDLGVKFTTAAPAEEFILRDGLLREVRTPIGTFAAEKFCLTTGSWSAHLGELLGLRLAIKPIRGQIALLHPAKPVINGIVYSGRKYFVARQDGRVLVGSTEEDVGFDKTTTSIVVRDLLDFALHIAPALNDATVEQSWAGLRPHSADGLPYLGRSPTCANMYVAAGHYRWGLCLSPATAVVMAQLMNGEPTLVDLAAFRLDREPKTVPSTSH
ncbi:MAG: glycine oxidase ThiO [Planctomycetia bacterium]|nr:glycine oxidase ThiO [Planctomycetia bacterium]